MSSAAELWHVYICVVEIRPQFDDLTTCQHKFFATEFITIYFGMLITY